MSAEIERLAELSEKATQYFRTRKDADPVTGADVLLSDVLKLVRAILSALRGERRESREAVAWLHRDGKASLSVADRKKQPKWLIAQEWADATPLYQASPSPSREAVSW